MKSFIALCFLAAICAMQVSANDPLDQLRGAVESAKRNVVSTIANLGRSRDNMIVTANQNLGTLRSRSMTNIENIVKPSLAEIRARIDQAKAEGKNVEHCYTIVQDSLHSILGTTFSGLRTCEANGKSQFQQAFAPFDAEMATGQAFMPQLDQVFPECYHSDTPQMQTCIVKQLDQINESIRSYQRQENTLIANAQNVLNNAISAVSTCIMGPESVARTGTNDLKIAADRCISN